jgi:uncharacterized protein DUF6603
MSSTGLLDRALAAFVASLAPLDDVISSPEKTAGFFNQFGWSLTATESTRVTTAMSSVTFTADPSTMSTEELVSHVGSAAVAVRSIAASGAPAAFASTFPSELLDFLVYSALAQHGPQMFGILHFGGVLTEQRLPADPATGRGEYVARRVHWDRLSGLAGDPIGTVNQTYGWGSAFDGDAFLRSVGILIQAFGGNAGLHLADRQLVAQFYADDAPSGSAVTNLVVSVPYLNASTFGDGVSASTSIALLGIPIPPSATVAAAPDGVALMPMISGQASESTSLSDQVTLTLGGDFLSRPVRAELHPGSAVVRGSPGDTHVDANARITATSPPTNPWRAFGDAESSRLEVSAVHAALGMSGDLDGDLDLRVEVGLDKAVLVIDLGEGDGFVQGALGSQPARSPLSFVIKWSSHAGFALGGSPQLAITLPVGESLGGIATITSVGLALVGVDNAVAFDATLTFSARLGPFAMTVADAGVRTLVRPIGDADPPGNLGNIDLDFGFKPPSGVGAAVNGSIITGGGFLEHKGDIYAGALDLFICGYAVKAFGLIQTPGGAQPGYSFVAVISIEFVPGITLPYDFTLDGVGGFIGIHRTISVDAVEAALWAHHLDGLLFPADPVAAAPQLISVLGSYFPAAEGRYVFGPLAKIGWAADIVTGEAALLLELPEPIKLLLIGEVQVGVPSGDPQLVLHISFDGGVDVGKQLAFFDATLHDSRLESYPISGDLAFRYGWGDQAVFALALGGFNPQFQPPAGFPTLKRLAISIHSSVARIEAQSYLALTSNTLQFGARVELTAGTGTFNVHGWLGFDALCERNPLAFEFDLTAGVDLRAGTDVIASVHLDGKLSGPTPWHIAGKASLSLLFFDVTVHFDKTWGTTAAALPAPDPLPALIAALADRSSWSGALPPTVRAAITPAGSPADAGDAVLLDPAATLRISQRVVPLDQPITRFAGTSLGQPETLTLNSLTAFGDATTPSGLTSEEFAPAQFLDLTDAEKLSLPSFSAFDSGVEVGGDATDLGKSSRTRAVITPISYVTTTLDSRVAPVPKSTYRPSLTTVLALGDSASSPQPGLGRYHPPPDTQPLVTLSPDRWTITNTDLTIQTDIPCNGSKLDAHLALNQYLATHPDDPADLQIVLTQEAT